MQLHIQRGHESMGPFSPDGKRVVNGALGITGTARIWEVVDWTLTKEEFEKQFEEQKLERYQAWLKKNEADKNTPAPPKK